MGRPGLVEIAASIFLLFFLSYFFIFNSKCCASHVYLIRIVLDCSDGLSYGCSTPLTWFETSEGQNLLNLWPHLSIHSSLHTSTLCPSIHPPIHQSIHLLIQSSTYPFIHPSIHSNVSVEHVLHVPGSVPGSRENRQNKNMIEMIPALMALPF